MSGADTPTPAPTNTPAPGPAPTSAPRPTRTPIPEGLLSNQIQAVGFDNNGNAWIGTDAGVSVRKHGNIWQYGEWTNYVRANSRLTSNDIRSICFDPFGYVWFGTEGGGANRLEPEDETWTSFSPANSGLVGNTVDVIACDGNGNVWFGTPSGLSRRSASGTWSTYNSGPVAGRQIQAIAIDQAGQAWFGTRGGGVAQRTLQGEWTVYTSENSGLPGNDVRAITSDPAGNVWFGLWGGGVSRLSPTGTWTTFNLNNSDLVSLYIHAIAADVAGHVWIGTWNGINRITSDGSWITYTTRNSGLADDQVETIGFDQEGNVWFGTRGGGISVLVGGVTLITPTPSSTPTTTATRTATATPTPTATPTGIPVPDLSMSTKVVDRPYAMPGDILEYTIAVTNASIYDARGVNVHDTLPSGLDYIAGSLQATGGNAEWSPSAQRIHWTGTAPGLETITIRFRAQVHQSITAGSELTNTAIIDDGYHSPFTRSATTRVGPFRAYLPMLDRNYTDSAQEICDGGFESGRFEPCWEHGGELGQSVTTEMAYAGSHAARLGDPTYACSGGVPVGKAWLSQTIQVPSFGAAVLSFNYRIFTHDRLHVSDYDAFEVYVNNALVLRSGNTTDNYGCGSPPNDSGWRLFTYDVSTYRGQTIDVRFENISRPDGWYNTWTYVDEIALNLR